MEAPHVLAGLFGANENGCRVFGSKNGEGGGSKDARARGLKEGEMARREWDKSESGAVQNGTGKGRRGKWR